MARIVCRGCDYDGEGEVDGAPTCPRCGSPDCRAAIAVTDLPADWWERLAKSTIPPEHVWGDAFAVGVNGEGGDGEANMPSNLNR